MERRVLIAISLSFLVLFFYQSYFAPPPPPPATQPTAGTAAPTAESPATLAPGGTPEPSPARPVTAAAPAAASTVVNGEAEERDITVETQTVRAVFTNRGARLRHWVLKHYLNDAGQELDLVPNADNVNNALTPFSLRLDDPTQTSRVNGALFRSTAPPSLNATSSVTLSFEWQDADGLSVAKTFTLQPDGYVVSVAVTAKQGDQVLNPAIDWGPGLGDDNAHASQGSFLAPSYSTPAQALVHRDSKVNRLGPAAGAEEGPFLYAGVDDHYFAALVLNNGEQPVTMRFDHTSFVVPPKAPDAPPGRYAAFSVRFPSPQATQRFYFGPKAFDDLRAINTEMVRVINFGIFSWLAVPLLGALKWVHQYVGNWGWAIVALTVLINLAMFPLRQKSVKSMRKMQEIQPQMKAIQARYAQYKITDPQRQKMNEEVMALYKEKGVNPASGCVPMLLTFPSCSRSARCSRRPSR
jgi:YidC/Oxa1 family membrane protein insertase